MLDISTLTPLDLVDLVRLRRNIEANGLVPLPDTARLIEDPGIDYTDTTIYGMSMQSGMVWAMDYAL